MKENTTRWFSFFCRSSSFVSICIPAVRGVFAVATLLVFDLQVRGGVGKADSESDFINGLNLQMWISPLNLLGYH